MDILWCSKMIWWNLLIVDLFVINILRHFDLRWNDISYYHQVYPLLLLPFYEKTRQDETYIFLNNFTNAEVSSTSGCERRDIVFLWLSPNRTKFISKFFYKNINKYLHKIWFLLFFILFEHQIRVDFIFIQEQAVMM